MGYTKCFTLKNNHRKAGSSVTAFSEGFVVLAVAASLLLSAKLSSAQTDNAAMTLTNASYFCANLSGQLKTFYGSKTVRRTMQLLLDAECSFAGANVVRLVIHDGQSPASPPPLPPQQLPWTNICSSSGREATVHSIYRNLIITAGDSSPLTADRAHRSCMKTIVKTTNFLYRNEPGATADCGRKGPPLCRCNHCRDTAAAAISKVLRKTTLQVGTIMVQEICDRTHTSSVNNKPPIEEAKSDGNDLIETTVAGCDERVQRAASRLLRQFGLQFYRSRNWCASECQQNPTPETQQLNFPQTTPISITASSTRATSRQPEKQFSCEQCGTVRAALDSRLQDENFANTLSAQLTSLCTAFSNESIDVNSCNAFMTAYVGHVLGAIAKDTASCEKNFCKNDSGTQPPAPLLASDVEHTRNEVMQLGSRRRHHLPSDQSNCFTCQLIGNVIWQALRHNKTQPPERKIRRDMGRFCTKLPDFWSVTCATVVATNYAKLYDAIKNSRGDSKRACAALNYCAPNVRQRGNSFQTTSHFQFDENKHADHVTGAATTNECTACKQAVALRNQDVWRNIFQQQLLSLLFPQQDDETKMPIRRLCAVHSASPPPALSSPVFIDNNRRNCQQFVQRELIPHVLKTVRKSFSVLNMCSGLESCKV